jgi:hypothetical protein
MRIFSLGVGAPSRVPSSSESALLDPESGTRLMAGAAARTALGEGFRSDSIVVVPDGSAVEIGMQGDSYRMDEPGAVLIRGGTPARVKVVEGGPLLLRTERAPSWYEPHQRGGRMFEDLLRLTTPYPHHGYDTSGLAWEREGVVAYLGAGKKNVWNGQASEWIVNSTAWPGQHLVGVSRVASGGTGLLRFAEIRPGETLHRHPERDGRRQVEAYMVTRGRAAIAAGTSDSLQYLVAGAGDLVVVEPGLEHCVAAVEGPSTFQYGYLFKEDAGGDTHAIMEGGMDALRRAAV